MSLIAFKCFLLSHPTYELYFFFFQETSNFTSALIQRNAIHVRVLEISGKSNLNC